MEMRDKDTLLCNQNFPSQDPKSDRSVLVLLLAQVEHPDRLLGRLDAAERHGTERGTYKWLSVMSRVLLLPSPPSPDTHTKKDAGQGRKEKKRKQRTHAVRTVDLRQLHAADDQAGHNLARALDDGILGAQHVQPAHAAELLELLHADEPLDGEGAERAYFFSPPPVRPS